jgi:hypothetical protein
MAKQVMPQAILRAAYLSKADKEVTPMVLGEPLWVAALWALQDRTEGPALQHPLQRQLQHHRVRCARSDGNALHDRRAHAKRRLPGLTCSVQFKVLCDRTAHIISQGLLPEIR